MLLTFPRNSPLSSTTPTLHTQPGSGYLAPEAGISNYNFNFNLAAVKYDTDGGPRHLSGSITRPACHFRRRNRRRNDSVRKIRQEKVCVTIFLENNARSDRSFSAELSRTPVSADLNTRTWTFDTT